MSNQPPLCHLTAFAAIAVEEGHVQEESSH